MTLPPGRLLVVDGNNLLHRSFHSPVGREVTTDTGAPANALFGLLMLVMRALGESEATAWAIALDGPGPTWRHARYPDYKKTRTGMDPALIAQFRLAIDFCRALGIPLIHEPAIEADDALATLVVLARAHGLETVILTGDKDAFQLVAPDVRVFLPRHGGGALEVVDAPSVLERLGVRPDQVVDFKALAGDASDSIPGVRGVGASYARDLLSAHQTLDGVYAALETAPDTIRATLRDKLEDERGVAYLSRDLARMVTNVPLSLSIDDLSIEGQDPTRAHVLTTPLGLTGIARRFPRLPVAGARRQDSPRPTPTYVQQQLFG